MPFFLLTSRFEILQNDIAPYGQLLDQSNGQVRSFFNTTEVVGMTEKSNILSSLRFSKVDRNTLLISSNASEPWTGAVYV